MRDSIDFMKIIVCVKQVPDTETTRPDRPRGQGDRRGGRQLDRLALRRVRDRGGARASRKRRAARSSSCPWAPIACRRRCATASPWAPTRAVHLKDPLFETTDTLGTARALAAAIKALGRFDLVLHRPAGRRRRQQPGPGPAGRAARPAPGHDGREARARGRQGHGRAGDRGRPARCGRRSLPAVISAQKGLNEPRYASLKGIMAAKKKTIEAKDAAALGPRRGGSRAAHEGRRPSSCRRRVRPSR